MDIVDQLKASAIEGLHQAEDLLMPAAAEIEKLQLALGAMLSAYDHEWEVGDAVVRCRKIVSDGQKPWDEIETLKERIETLQQVVREQHAYGVEQLKENDRLREALKKISESIGPEHTNELIRNDSEIIAIARSALQQKDSE